MWEMRILVQYGLNNKRGSLNMKKVELLKMIDECISLCKKEETTGYQGEATQMQIERFILPEMYELKYKVMSGNVPNNRNDRYILAFGSAFKVWGWDMENPTDLYLALLHLHTAYQSCETLT